MSLSTPSFSYTCAKSSSSTLSVPSSSRPMFRGAVYKPPRSSPLAGPAISLNDNDDEKNEDGDVGFEDERTRTSAMSSRIPSPYPTPPRTPSPISDNPGGGVQSALDTPNLEVLSIGTSGSKRTRTKSQIFSTHDRSPSSAFSGIINAPSQFSESQNASPSQARPRVHVRTPFSAPPTMPMSHPTYDTNTISRRIPSRPRTAPSRSSMSPRERGTFSAPDIIRPTTANSAPAMPANNLIGPQLSSNSSSLSLSSSSRRHAGPNTSTNPELNWITTSNRPPPPFTRTRLKSVTMPIRASRTAQSTNRPKTTPVLIHSSQVKEAGASQPIEASIEERNRCQRVRTLAPPSTRDTDDRRRMLKEPESIEEPGPGKSLQDVSQDRVPERLALEEHQTGPTKKWKLFLRKVEQSLAGKHH